MEHGSKQKDKNPTLVELPCHWVGETQHPKHVYIVSVVLSTVKEESRGWPVLLYVCGQGHLSRDGRKWGGEHVAVGGTALGTEEMAGAEPVRRAGEWDLHRTEGQGAQCGCREEAWATRAESRAMARACDLFLSDMEPREVLCRGSGDGRGCTGRVGAETPGDDSSRPGSGPRERGSRLEKGQVEA